MMLKDTLLASGHSLVASNGYCSDKSGIRPVILPMNEDLRFFEGLSVADKIVGKASAMLLALSGAKEVYAHILSEAGRKILERYGIAYEYGEMVEYIVNRKGDGMCPMEETVKDIDDPMDAFKALNERIAQMRKGM
jgi:iron complex outermembrane receptor protein